MSATFLGSTAPSLGTGVFSECKTSFRIYYPAGGTGYDSLGYPAQSPSGIDVPVSGNLKVTFKDAMDTLTIGTVTLSSEEGSVALDPAGGSWSADSLTYTIPYAGLSYETEYTVSISGFQDAAENEMAADSTYDFKTVALVPVTGINGVPTTATAGTDLTLSGTVAPEDATNQTITWSVRDAGTTGATISGNTLSTTDTGTVTVTAMIINGLTASTNYTKDFDITVNAAPVVNTTINPVTDSFDRKTANQADVQATITWGSASSVSNVKAGGTSIGADNYTVSGDTLIIRKEYLAAQSTGSLVLTVEFNAGAAATLTITITDTTPPTISLTSCNFYLNAPADVSIAITWNSAASVTDVVYSVSPDTTLYTLGTGDYTVVDNDLTINDSFFTDISVTTGDPNAQVNITQASSLPGSATVTVTAEDGTTIRTYTVNLTIAVPSTTYTVTFSSNGSVYATKTVNAGISIGSTAWPADPARNRYTFGGWFTGENGAGTRFTSGTPVNATMTVYAKWTYSGGSDDESSSDGGNGTFSGDSTPSTPAAPDYNAGVNVGNGTETKLPVTINKDNETASIDTGSQSFAQGGTVITIPSIPNVNTYLVVIPVPKLSTTDDQGTLTVNTDTGSITVPSNMLTGVEGISGSKAQISIGQGDKSNLSTDIKAAIGDRPLIQLTLFIDGKQTGWSSPNVPVTVSIPYEPTAEELKNPESIVIWYIDGSGNVVTIPDGHYDPATGMVTFDTTHFSDYAVAYNPVSFNDVAAGAWYNKAVSFIAARGITGGTGNGNYNPDAKLTRGEFLVMLMKAYGIAPDTNSTDNFSDAGNTYYTGYLAAAKRLGITAGVGNNQYAPGKEITRQELFTLLYNALKVIGQLPQGDSGKTLSDFGDTGDIALWAKEAMRLLVETGTIGGCAGSLAPTNTTTRAEMAQVLFNLLGK